MHRASRIFVAGECTLVGRALVRVLKDRGYTNVTSDAEYALQLQHRLGVDQFIEKDKPEYVFLVAGKSAGIMGNVKFPADLMLDNLTVQCNVIESTTRHGVTKLLYLASSCCYPRNCPQPMKAEYLLTGPLEPTNEPYAIAKIAGLKLVQSYRRQYGANFVSGIPANSYGLHDDFDIENAHVIGALLRKMHEAKLAGATQVEIWGTGKPEREFVFSEDLASACILAMEDYDREEPLNLGSGQVYSIAHLAQAIKEVTGFQGGITFDASKPDGMPAKILDSQVLAGMGWKAGWSLKAGLEKTYDWYRQNKSC